MRTPTCSIAVEYEIQRAKLTASWFRFPCAEEHEKEAALATSDMKT